MTATDTIDTIAPCAAQFLRRLTVLASLSLADAAKALGISEDGMKRLLDAGEMPYTKIGKLYRVFPEDINFYLERNTKTGR